MSDVLVCPVCRHPMRKHDLFGCNAGGGSCWCDGTADGVPTPPVAAEPAAAHGLALPAVEPLEAPRLPRNESLRIAPTGVGVKKPPTTAPRRAQPAAPVLGSVVVEYPAFACVLCGSRRYEPYSCCDRSSIPVTVTITRREAS